MVFQQEAAYALASWRRFDANITDQLARAITSAFALVAIADGDLAQSEIDRFMVLIREQVAVLAPLNIDRVELQFRDIAGAILSDPSEGHSHALELIAAVAGDAIHCELVRAAAEIAITADNRELSSEQEVLQEICAALGIALR
jgi:tellurite resistance protein